MTTSIVTAEFAELPQAAVKLLLKEFKAAEAAEKKAKEKTNAKRQALIDAMAGAEVLLVEETQQEVAYFRPKTSNLFDTTRFRADHPDIAKLYNKVSSSRPFRLAAGI